MKTFLERNFDTTTEWTYLLLHSIKESLQEKDSKNKNISQEDFIKNIIKKKK